MTAEGYRRQSVTTRGRRPLRVRPGHAGSPAPVLSASEIGAFTFCPEAWYLQRRGAARDHAATERLMAGIHAHRRLGQRTDQLQLVRTMRRLLFVAIVLLIAWVALQLVGAPAPFA